MGLTDLNTNSRVLDQLIVSPPTHRLSCFGKHGCDKWKTWPRSFGYRQKG